MLVFSFPIRRGLLTGYVATLVSRDPVYTLSADSHVFVTMETYIQVCVN